MTELTKLVVDYQQNKDNVNLNKIFSLLSSDIKRKAEKLWKLPLTKIGEGEEETYFDLKARKEVTRKKGIYIRLIAAQKMISQEDIEQELFLELMVLLNKYDNTKGDFENYFYSTLRQWIPPFVNKEFIKSLHHLKTESVSEDDEGCEAIQEIIVPVQKEAVIDDLFENLTEQERKVLNVMKDDLNAGVVEIAEIMGVTHQRISQITESIKRKYKKN